MCPHKGAAERFPGELQPNRLAASNPKMTSHGSEYDMPHRIRAERAACIDNLALFQHELLEDPSLARGDGERQRRLTLLTDQARATRAECPLFESCLYDAVVKHDVAGFVAGTTERQRSQIRSPSG